MKHIAFPILMTVLWGLVFCSAMHSLTMGICMGLMMGIAFELSDSEKQTTRKKSKANYTMYGGYDNERDVCKVDACYSACLFCGSRVYDLRKR